MTLRTWVSSASHDSSIPIKAEFEAHAVYLVRNWLDTLRPLGGVRDQMSCTVSRLCRPTVINVEVLVASVFQSQ
jgi:hypothetical protein